MQFPIRLSDCPLPLSAADGQRSSSRRPVPPMYIGGRTDGGTDGGPSRTAHRADGRWLGECGGQHRGAIGRSTNDVSGSEAEQQALASFNAELQSAISSRTPTQPF